MRHADFIEIWENEGYSETRCAPVFSECVELVANVPAWFFYMGEKLADIRLAMNAHGFLSLFRLIDII